MECGWLTTRPGRFAPGKESRFPLCRCHDGPQGRSERVRKIWPPFGFFVHAFFFLVLFFLPSVYLMSSYYWLLYNRNVHAADGIRTRNPSKRAAPDPRRRPLGHWDRQFDPGPSRSVASRYSDWFILARTHAQRMVRKSRDPRYLTCCLRYYVNSAPP